MSPRQRAEPPVDRRQVESAPRQFVRRLSAEQVFDRPRAIGAATLLSEIRKRESNGKRAWVYVPRRLQVPERSVIDDVETPPCGSPASNLRSVFDIVGVVRSLR